ncbi:MAG: DUF2231 domain-containing protein [Myxococcota bacterium]
MGSVPLHPAVVHIPLALAFLLPLFALGAGFMAWHGGSAGRRWIVVPVLALLMFGSALVASSAGEQDEERVERVVPGAALEAHEEWGEAFVWSACGTLLVALFGMAPGAVLRRGAIVATTVGSVAVASVAFQTGKLGGELVYEHGAADAHRPLTEPSRSAEEPPHTSVVESPLAEEHDED